MNLKTFPILLLGLTLAAAAVAAPKPLDADMSANRLMDGATADRIWKENIPANVAKLYPAAKFRFVSQISGGFTASKACVVTARAMLMPVVRLPVQGPKVVYAPITGATAFDTIPDATEVQCQDLAKAKLKEAVRSVAASLASS